MAFPIDLIARAGLEQDLKFPALSLKTREGRGTPWDLISDGPLGLNSPPNENRVGWGTLEIDGNRRSVAVQAGSH